jgi:hypothetical protein
MSTNLQHLIGDHPFGEIRGLRLGTPLAEAINKEGEDYSERKRRNPHLKYFKNLTQGEELELVIYYDEARAVSGLKLYYNYYLAAHQDDVQAFEKLATEALSAFTELYGAATEETRVEAGKEKYFYTWLIPLEEEQSVKLILMIYPVTDPEDYKYDRQVFQLEYKKYNP